MITQSQIETFQRDGVVMLEGLLTDWVDEMRAGVARNMAEPGEYASENAVTEGRKLREDWFPVIWNQG